MAAAQIKLQWECISNFYRDNAFLAELTICNVGDAPLCGDDWALYFNSARRLEADTFGAGAIFEHVNGDLFRLRPLADFAPLAPGASRAIRYAGAPWAISETDAPLGFYLVRHADSGQAHAIDIGDPHILPFERIEQRMRSRADRLPPMTPALRFDDNAGLQLLPRADVGLVTPAPLYLQRQDGFVAIDAATPVLHDGQLEGEARYLRAALAGLPTASTNPEGRPHITLRIGAVVLDAPELVAAEAYRLQIGAQAIVVVGASAHGVFNAIQSLLALLDMPLADDSAAARVPCALLVDAPRFAYRGMLLDVARHFSSKETVLRLLDCMARYKLNKFHLHLTDDEGWRLEIAALPELTALGGRRGFSGDGCDALPPSFGSGAAIGASSGSGYYSRAEFIDILRYAAQRHIEVIPEFNLPGHARAAVKSMLARHARLLAAGQVQEAQRYLLSDLDDCSAYESVQLWRDNVICIALPSCYRFIEAVVAEVVAIHGEAGVPLSTIHIGGDEVPHGAWSGSPQCAALMAQQGWTEIAPLQDYFLTRCRQILAKHGLLMAGWEEIAGSRAEADGDLPRAAPASDTVDAGLRIYAWNNSWGGGQEDFAYRLANAGYQVVLANANNLYFDLAYAKEPQEPGYYWSGFVETRATYQFCPLDIYATATVDTMGAPLDAEQLAPMTRLSAVGRANVLGMQGQLWGENARSRERVEYLALPRLIALAERAWARDPGWAAIADPFERSRQMECDWNEFANRLGQRELARIDSYPHPYGYRIAAPGVKLMDGACHANLSTPGMAMHYTLDGDEPSAASPPYVQPVAVPAAAAVFKIATFNRLGRKSRTVTIDLVKGNP